MAADRLLIFCTAPVPGRVKRMLPVISPAAAALLYEASLRDVITLAGRERARVELWYDMRTAESYFEREYPQLRRQCQRGGGPGARQRDAFERSFADGAERVVVMAGDSPTLPDTHLNAAFDALREAPAVLGPAQAGGYYLIGLNAMAWPQAGMLFDGIPATVRDLMMETLQRATMAGLELRLLPGWYDLRRPADLALLRQDVTHSSHVAQWLNQHPDA